jgi:hypothetical protein|tara:strand:- start:494 stop:1363 length:870 start_codon:yes stop_codon:yes gene_type:complete
MDFKLKRLGKQHFQYEIKAGDIGAGEPLQRSEYKSVELAEAGFGGPSVDVTAFAGLSVLKVYTGGVLTDMDKANHAEGYTGGVPTVNSPGSKARLLFNLSADGSFYNTGNPYGPNLTVHGPGLNANQNRVLVSGIVANNHNLTDAFITSAFFGGESGVEYFAELAIANGYHGSVLALVDGDGHSTQWIVNSARRASPRMQGQTPGPAGATGGSYDEGHFALSAVQGAGPKGTFLSLSGTTENYDGGNGGGASTVFTAGAFDEDGAPQALSGKGISLSTSSRRLYYLGNK